MKLIVMESEITYQHFTRWLHSIHFKHLCKVENQPSSIEYNIDFDLFLKVVTGGPNGKVATVAESESEKWLRRIRVG